MVTTSRYLEAPRRLRAFVRAHETSLVVLAALVGTIGGLVVAAMGAAVAGLHMLLFNLEMGERLSSQLRIEPLRALLVPSLGGLLLGVAFLLLLRWRPAREIDPIEANALHGGRMSFRGSVIVALQTIWSSGVGASVGLEAGFTQLSSGLAASLGRAFHLRRSMSHKASGATGPLRHVDTGASPNRSITKRQTSGPSTPTARSS